MGGGQGAGESEWCLVHLGVTVPPGPRCPPQRSAQVGQEDLCLRRRFGTLEGRLGRQTGPSPGWPGSCITFSRASLPVVRGTRGTHLLGAEPSGLLTHVTLQTVGPLSCRDGVPSLGAHPPRGPRRGAGCGGRPESCLPGWGVLWAIRPAPRDWPEASWSRRLSTDAWRQRGAGLHSVV